MWKCGFDGDNIGGEIDFKFSLELIVMNLVLIKGYRPNGTDENAGIKLIHDLLNSCLVQGVGLVERNMAKVTESGFDRFDWR